MIFHLVGRNQSNKQLSHSEIGFKADELQNLTNAVSYLFFSGNEGCEIGFTLAYYPDLPCERGRSYLHKILQGIPSGTDSAVSCNEDVLCEARES